MRRLAHFISLPSPVAAVKGIRKAPNLPNCQMYQHQDFPVGCGVSIVDQRFSKQVDANPLRLTANFTLETDRNHQGQVAIVNHSGQEDSWGSSFKWTSQKSSLKTEDNLPVLNYKLESCFCTSQKSGFTNWLVDYILHTTQIEAYEKRLFHNLRWIIRINPKDTDVTSQLKQFGFVARDMHGPYYEMHKVTLWKDLDAVYKRDANAWEL